MPKPSAADRKRKALLDRGALHPHPERITDELFQQDAFFDPRDLVQVKYEMVRRVRVDRKPIRRVAKEFGFSRPSVYQARAAVERAGLPGLLPAKRGPRRAHKMDDAVMAFVREELLRDPALRAVGLSKRLRARFGLAVHTRTIQRALRRHEKKLHDETARPASENDPGVEGTLTDRYERLRGQVLNGFGGLGETVGLGVLMSEGMGAWILKCREFAPVVTDGGSRGSVAAAIAFELQAQVVTMIAGMVLNHRRRELR